MIKAVKSKKVKNNLVLGKIYIDFNTLVISPKEIMILKIGDNIIKNKYVVGAERLNFPSCGNMKVDDAHYKIVYEKDTTYLHFGGHVDFSLYFDYYTNIKNKTICYNKSAIINNHNEERFELTYEELNSLFNPTNYDGMYVLNTSGDILLAYNKSDGLVIDNEIISNEDKSDESIIYKNNDTHDKFNNIVITVSGNSYEINLFNIKYNGLDKYEISISNLKNKSVTKEYISGLINNDDYVYSAFTQKNKIYKKAI